MSVWCRVGRWIAGFDVVLNFDGCEFSQSSSLRVTRPLGERAAWQLAGGRRVNQRAGKEVNIRMNLFHIITAEREMNAGRRDRRRHQIRISFPAALVRACRSCSANRVRRQSRRVDVTTRSSEDSPTPQTCALRLSRSTWLESRSLVYSALRESRSFFRTLSFLKPSRSACTDWIRLTWVVMYCDDDGSADEIDVGESVSTDGLS